MTCAQRPDVDLMDVSMPEMNGVDAARIIRRDYPDTAVIVISQNDPEVTKRQSISVGATEYVAKADLSRNLLGAFDKIVGSRNGAAAQTSEAAPHALTKDHIASLAGGGEMGALMRTRDWSESAL
jgi:CheY-like chemotaxis protein